MNQNFNNMIPIYEIDFNKTKENNNNDFLKKISLLSNNNYRYFIYDKME